MSVFNITTVLTILGALLINYSLTRPMDSGEYVAKLEACMGMTVEQSVALGNMEYVIAQCEKSIK